jgi:hypothetical protein
MVPERLEGRPQRLKQLVLIDEHAIGQGLAEHTKDLFSGLPFGTVGWQKEGRHPFWPLHRVILVAGSVVEDYSQRLQSAHGTQGVHLYLQPVARDMRQQEDMTQATPWFDGHVHPRPAIVLLDSPGWPTPAPSAPRFPAKAAFSKGPDLVKGCYGMGNVFLKASCCSADERTWRCRPVFLRVRSWRKCHQMPLMLW